MDELQEKEQRHKWLISQFLWHSSRHATKNSKWHKQQFRFYRKAAGKVFTLSEVISRTMRRYSSELADSVTANNALYRRLKTGNN